MDRSKRKKVEKPRPMVCSICQRKLSGTYFRNTREKDVFECIYCASSYLPLTEEPIRPNAPALVAIDAKTKNVYTKDWSSNDEILLLNCVQQLGIGNWHSIHEWIPNHTVADIETHYNNLYIFSKNAPLPDEIEKGEELTRTFEIPPPPEYDTSPNRSSNPSLRNETDPKNPAESSGWMPYRHEFENEYINRADEIVGDLKFLFSPGEETWDTFNDKIHKLQVYNNHLVEREKRNHTLEEFNIMSKKEKKEFFNSKTEEHLRTDEALFPLSSYIEPKMMNRLISILHEGEATNSHIDKCIHHIEFGARSVEEGKNVSILMKCIKDGKVDKSKINEWNSVMKRLVDKEDEVPEYDFIKEEQDFVRDHEIANQLYLALKDLLIREYSINNSLTLEDAISLSPSNKDVISDMYNLFVELGWL